MADEPYSVNTEPAVERLARWGRRHRSSVALAGLFLLLAAVGSSLAALWIRRAEQQRFEEYRFARDAVVNTNSLIAPLDYAFVDTWPSTSREGEQIVSAAQAAGSLIRRQPGDQELLRCAALLSRYAANYHSGIGMFGEASLGFQRAEMEFDRLVHTPDMNVDPELLMMNRASLQREMGGYLQATGDLAAARKRLDAALQMAAQVKVNREVQRARILVDRAELLLTVGEFEAADKDAQQAIEAMRVGYEEWKDPNPQRLLIPIRATNTRAAVARQQNDLDRAEELHEEAIDQMWRQQEQRRIGNRDIRYQMSLLQISKCQTWARMPATESKQRSNLGGVIQELTVVGNACPWIPAFPAAIAQANRLLGELNLRTQRPLGDCERPLVAARTALETLVRNHPDWVAPRRELTLTYLALVKLHSIYNNEQEQARYRELAEQELAEVQRRSPLDYAAKQMKILEQ
ncbi:MAG: tetratricopeptide repeat protein [Planctomycetota bacterium]